ncbi:MAG: DDE-type integrase/transposase/recombinase, partial [Acidimicrobiia bacterium]
MPNATPTWVVNELLTFAVTEPTIGCRQYADRLDDRGYSIGKSTVQDILVRHGLGKRHQRVARAAALAVLTSGLITETAADDRLFGFCHWSARPGDLVALDSFYIGNLKGVGKVYQLTAIDTATRWAFIMIVLGVPNGTITARFVHQLIGRYRRLGVTVRCVLTDNGPEYIAHAFTDALAKKELTHQRIPPRSPNYNAVCERFQGTALQECWRPAFHRRRSPAFANSNSKARSTPGSCTTTIAAATTATSCTAAHPAPSSTATATARQHDHQTEVPSVTSIPGPEELERRVDVSAVVGRRCVLDNTIQRASRLAAAANISLSVERSLSTHVSPAEQVGGG